MKAVSLEVQPGRKEIFWVGAKDPDRTAFDDLIPTPRGTTYNAYLVKGGEATALIDTVEPEFYPALRQRLLDAAPDNLRYVVSNHAEQDHSGSLPALLADWPDVQVVTSPKGKAMLLTHLDLPEQRIITMADGATLSLGDRTLHFIHAPWVHWPETMFTYLQEDRLLFPCDLFGSHMSSDALLASHVPQVMDEARRYYATIMMPFAKNVIKHLARLDGMELDIIAPSHGPVWDKPSQILGAYRRWSAAAPLNKAVVVYVSMHGSTRTMALHLAEALRARGVHTDLFDLATADEGVLASSLIDTPTLVLGSPTVLGGAHPKALYAASLVKLLKPHVQTLAAFGSYAWGGRMVEKIKEVLAPLKAQVLEPVTVKGLPRAETFTRLDRLADDIAERHRQTLSQDRP